MIWNHYFLTISGLLFQQWAYMLLFLTSISTYVCDGVVQSCTVTVDGGGIHIAREKWLEQLNILPFFLKIVDLLDDIVTDGSKILCLPIIIFNRILWISLTKTHYSPETTRCSVSRFHANSEDSLATFCLFWWALPNWFGHEKLTALMKEYLT